MQWLAEQDSHRVVSALSGHRPWLEDVAKLFDCNVRGIARARRLLLGFTGQSLEEYSAVCCRYHPIQTGEIKTPKVADWPRRRGTSGTKPDQPDQTPRLNQKSIPTSVTIVLRSLSLPDAASASFSAALRTSSDDGGTCCRNVEFPSSLRKINAVDGGA